MDGVAPVVHQGPLLSGGLAWGALELGVSGQFGLPVHPATEYGTLRFRRYVACVWGGWEQDFRRGLSVGTRLRMGGLGYYRSTPRSAEVSPEQAHLVPSWVVGAEGRLGWLADRGAIWTGVSVGVDALPRTVRFGYDVQGRYQPALTAGRFHPRAAMSVEYRFR
jgi:hypothetical protein